MASPRETQRCSARLDDTKKYQDREDIDLGHYFEQLYDLDTGQWTILHGPLLFFNRPTHVYQPIYPVGFPRAIPAACLTSRGAATLPRILDQTSFKLWVLKACVQFAETH